MGTFEQRLKDLRKEKGITIEKLAIDLGSAKSTISRYENGLRDPKKDFLEMLSDYFNVSVDYLLGNSNNRNHDVVKSNNFEEEKDIEKMIDELMEQQGLMLCGELLNDDDMILLRNSIRSTIELAKTMKNKK